MKYLLKESDNKFSLKLGESEIGGINKYKIASCGDKRFLQLEISFEILKENFELSLKKEIKS
ncbi:hypothetical protein [Hominibacterium faecale]|uniref:hypothetical protein n=1 Tax=Hominibacterium faecale TaxID=2839743 RepID=UPI0022B29FD1|nr:hypothetical protein [Hominibacterium faecale]